MENIAVIDTETNWIDETMSIGIVIANSNYQIIKKLYYILTPECNMGGMFQNVLLIDGVELSKKDSRKQVILSIKQELINNHVTDIFAYNALFDYYHLIELKNYIWHDIIKMAAYKQYNKMIPEEVKCFKTGRIIKGFGVEPVYRMLSNNCNYFEVHNALCDAVDELKIMEMLNLDINIYPALEKK